MTPKLEYVDIVFENCDFIRIDASYILGMGFTEISNYLWSNTNGQLIEENVCKEFEIELENDALKIKTQFQKDFSEEKSIDSFKHHLDVYKDITHISVKPENRESIYIAVPWKEDKENETKNIYEKTSFEKDTFTIICGENNK
jgi:hypothetical protein